MRKNKVDEKVVESRKAAYKAKKHKADKWWDVGADGVVVKIPEPKDEARKSPNYIRAPNEKAAFAKMAARRTAQAASAVVDVA
jgi:hypothetical protein